MRMDCLFELWSMRLRMRTSLMRFAKTGLLTGTSEIQGLAPSSGVYRKLRSQLGCSSLEQIDQHALDATSPHADPQLR